jgi:hypothetical protein
MSKAGNVGLGAALISVSIFFVLLPSVQRADGYRQTRLARLSVRDCERDTVDFATINQVVVMTRARAYRLLDGYRPTGCSKSEDFH